MPQLTHWYQRVDEAQQQVLQKELHLWLTHIASHNPLNVASTCVSSSNVCIHICADASHLQCSDLLCDCVVLGFKALFKISTSTEVNKHT